MINGTALFIGVESQNWTIQDFQIAARNAKALGVSSLIVKVADGTNVWYSQGWKAILNAIDAQDVNAIPYVYSYGNTFNDIDIEISILTTFMRECGIVIADTELEWNGQVSWAQTLAQALKDKSGLFAITTWADPQIQNWQGVMEILKPVVDVWMPQVYSDYLASVYQQQFAGLNVIPVLSLDEGFGPNDVVQHAREAQSQALALWEYQQATGGYQQEVKNIVAMSKIPQGWSDDGTTLRCPDGTPVVLGFRQFVLNNNWNPDDIPLKPEYGANPIERSNPSLGPGTAQEFRMTRLCWTPERGVYRSWIGQELKWYQDNQK
jgi:hypothetical protein